MKTKTIRVTREDILKGKPWNPSQCPVARAIRRQCKFKPIVAIGNATLDKACQIDMPESVRDFATKFDAGIPVKPFTFRIRL